MTRTMLIAFALVLGMSGSGFAQQWANKMFKVTSHNFGEVARDSKTEFAFELQNIYEEDIHISGVRTSCGCTSPSITKQSLKTWEKGAILAHLNTDRFTGHKSATITVTIDRPYFAEVQLQVQAVIRTDVSFAPGVVNFGSVDQGDGVVKLVDVSQVGQSNWAITDVRSQNSNLEVSLTQTERAIGRVRYQMTVTLKPNAVPGYLQDQLVIVTNDGKSIPLSVEGRVSSPLTVSPAALFLGVIQPGEQATKQLVVRGKKPFRIVDVRCNDPAFAFRAPDDEAKVIHFLPVTYTAGQAPGKISERIQIITDLGATASCDASATVQAAAANE